MLVRGLDLGAVGEVVGVGGVVVDDDDVDGSGGLQEREDRVVLMGFAAVDEGEFWLGGDERGAGVGVEGVGVDGVFVSGGDFVGGEDDGGEVRG